MDLAEEIVLKPEHYFLVLRERRQLRFLVQQLSFALLLLDVVAFAKMLRASFAPFR